MADNAGKGSKQQKAYRIGHHNLEQVQRYRLITNLNQVKVETKQVGKQKGNDNKGKVYSKDDPLGNKLTCIFMKKLSYHGVAFKCSKIVAFYFYGLFPALRKYENNLCSVQMMPSSGISIY